MTGTHSELCSDIDLTLIRHSRKWNSPSREKNVGFVLDFRISGCRFQVQISGFLGVDFRILGEDFRIWGGDIRCRFQERNTDTSGFAWEHSAPGSALIFSPGTSQTTLKSLSKDIFHQGNSLWGKTETEFGAEGQKMGLRDKRWG